MTSTRYSVPKIVQQPCYLKKLAGKPGYLEPKFAKNKFNYKLIVGAQELKTVLDVLPMNANDEIVILRNGTEVSNVIKFEYDQVIDIQILVKSEVADESRIYHVTIKRLSPHIAHLDFITIQPGRLIPRFDRNIFEYNCYLGALSHSVKLTVKTPDPRCTVKVNNEDLKQSYELICTRTTLTIFVKSVDESVKQTYVIHITRKQIPRYICLSDPIERLKYEDPISLSPLNCPVKILDHEIWSIMSDSSAIKLVKLNKIGFGKRVFEERPIFMAPDYDTDVNLSNAVGSIVLTYGGFTNSVRLSNMHSVLTKCSELSPFKAQTFQCLAPTSDKYPDIPQWQEIYENSYFEIDEKPYEECLRELTMEYFFFRPQSERNIVYEPDENPLHILKMLITHVCREIRIHQSNHKLHYHLGLLLEEKFLLTDILGINTDFNQSLQCEQGTMASNYNQSILRLCRRHGIKDQPTLCQALRILKEEHSNLMEDHDLIEADKIQNLYEYKKKEADKEGKMSVMVTISSTPLGQAAIKYKTALTLHPKNVSYQYQVARMLIIEGKYGEAVIHLESAIAINSNHWPSKTLLGFALANLVRLSDVKQDRTIELLLDTTELAMKVLSSQSYSSENAPRKSQQKFLSDDSNFYRITNPLISFSVFSLARLIDKRPKYASYMKPIHAYHLALHLATLGWIAVSRGYILSQFEYIIIKCQDVLLSRIKEEGIIEIPSEVYVRRSEWLNCFISACSLEPTEELLKLQLSICRYLVFYQPCNEYYLINLGMVLLKMAKTYPSHHDEYKENVRSAILIFKNAIDLSGQSMFGNPSSILNEAGWFKEQRVNYITKKAPKIIIESLKVVDNDMPGSQFHPFGFYVRKPKKGGDADSNRTLNKKTASPYDELGRNMPKSKQKFYTNYPSSTDINKLSGDKYMLLTTSSIDYTQSDSEEMDSKRKFKRTNKENSINENSEKLRSSFRRISKPTNKENSINENSEKLRSSFRRISKPSNKEAAFQEDVEKVSNTVHPHKKNKEAMFQGVPNVTNTLHRFSKKNKEATFQEDVEKVPNNLLQIKVSRESEGDDSMEKSKPSVHLVSKAKMIRKSVVSVDAESRPSLFRRQSSIKNKTSLVKSSMKNNLLGSHLYINPPTVYSRLMLARAFTMNNQNVEAIKCYNFVRKQLQNNDLKKQVNNEIIEILNQCSTADKALEYINKLRIAESKLTPDDILLVREIICLFVRIDRVDDDRINRYFNIIIKHEGNDALRGLLGGYDLTESYDKYTKLFVRDISDA